ncbi:DUF533 domain-containing protein [Gemmobacter serpentinus]|uniref:DUF533 domain-containing protein n=1 Tax=Gemmobacter serpentinus TaxID=2652247 RepID=UPI001CF6F0B3|nr:DUF533 domain-containing protein [Gemmobacter serpentinus]
MSLVKTLAKMAIGVAVAKGVSHIARNGLPGSGGAAQAGGATTRSAGRSRSGQGGFDELMGSLEGMVGGKSASTPRRGTQANAGQANAGQAGTGGLGDLLGGMLGGGAGGASGGLGGLGSLLEGLAGGGAAAPRGQTRRSSAPTGLDGLLGSGGIGDLLGGLVGAAGAGAATSRGGMGGGLGGLLDAVLSGNATEEQPSRDQELAAALMLRAMIQAVKADGNLDAEEKRKLMAALDDASEQEVAFVNAELAAPLDVEGLIQQVPQGMEAQVYAISLSAIDLDNRAEAQYLHSLAQGLGLDPQDVNQIHDQAGAQRIYG